ncbi:SCO family protein [Duganella sp. BuS-21]|uniref:SCO family protein n=1 Tax=Duganella sp. BuS-21 TaxID=2943848 RepID=UPI0035A59512
MKNWRHLNSSSLAPTLVAALLVCGLGTAALHQGSMGYEVVSTEDGRRLAISRAPLAVPDMAVHAPDAARFGGLLQADGRVAIVTFIYSSCNAVCSVLGSEYQQLQDAIRQRGLQNDVRLLSISFDPRDTPSVLAAYARRQHADPALWRMIGVDRADDRKALLDAFGIVVLPAPMGEFQHNAAFHLIDRDGRLAQITDDDNPAQALEHAVAMAHRPAATGGSP